MKETPVKDRIKPSKSVTFTDLYTLLSEMLHEIIMLRRDVRVLNSKMDETLLHLRKLGSGTGESSSSLSDLSGNGSGSGSGLRDGNQSGATHPPEKP